MHYRDLLFDVDNTLLDFDANEADSFRHMLNDLEENYSDELYAAYHKLNTELWRGIERKEYTIEEVLNTRFSRLMKIYGREVDGRLWENTYRTYLNRGTQEMPHVHEVLGKLKGRYRLSIITNGLRTTQEYRLRESGIGAYFDYIFISEDLGANKPSREFFDYVKRGIPGFLDSRALVIGDSLTSDIKGGYDAGLDTCWINRNCLEETENVTPTYVICDLRGLLRILEA